jgi:hypothetical protein
MKEPSRTAWSRPELVVLVRGGLEENVVTMPCKGGFSGGATDDFGACMEQPLGAQNGLPCEACMSIQPT